MNTAELREVLEWSYARILEGEHSIQSFYDYMKLIDALEAIIHTLDAESQPKGKYPPYLQLVDDNYRPNTCYQI